MVYSKMLYFHRTPCRIHQVMYTTVVITIYHSSRGDNGTRLHDLALFFSIPMSFHCASPKKNLLYVEKRWMEQKCHRYVVADVNISSELYSTKQTTSDEENTKLFILAKFPYYSSSSQKLLPFLAHFSYFLFRFYILLKLSLSWI